MRHINVSGLCWNCEECRTDLVWSMDITGKLRIWCNRLMYMWSYSTPYKVVYGSSIMLEIQS